MLCPLSLPYCHTKGTKCSGRSVKNIKWIVVLLALWAVYNSIDNIYRRIFCTLGVLRHDTVEGMHGAEESQREPQGDESFYNYWCDSNSPPERLKGRYWHGEKERDEQK